MHWSISSHSITIHTHTRQGAAGLGVQRLQPDEGGRLGRLHPRLGAAARLARGRHGGAYAYFCLLGRVTTPTMSVRLRYTYIAACQNTLHTQSLRDGVQHGAAVLGVPMKATVKVCGGVCPLHVSRDHRFSAESSRMMTPSNRRCEQESEDGEFVLRTINRARLWEIQTPQVRFWKYFGNAQKHKHNRDE